MTHDEALAIFRETGALLEGHFLLRSGLHSRHFFQCARVCEHLDKVTLIATALREQLADLSFETVVAPAIGGLVIGQEVARQAGARFLFVEKNAEGSLELRRGFALRPGERILIVEDVITRGGRVQETLEIVRAHGGEPLAVAVVVDRSEGKARFDVPLRSVLSLSFPTYAPDALPEDLAATPAVKPGS
ncbi:MAG: orotate phosphoribosyltransferase [Opitutales bacterium]